MKKQNFKRKVTSVNSLIVVGRLCESASFEQIRRFIHPESFRGREAAYMWRTVVGGAIPTDPAQWRDKQVTQPAGYFQNREEVWRA